MAGLPCGDPIVHLPTPPARPQIGALLAELVDRFDIERLLYFGGAAAPLLSDALLARLLARLGAAERLLLVNNRFSTDWAGIVPARTLLAHVDALPRDNMLGWVLSTAGGLPVESLPATAETRLDIDTPLELLALRLHPQTPPQLRRMLAVSPLDTEPMGRLLSVLSRSASRILLAGRVGPEAWQALNQATHCWFRVLAEERGMVASGRSARREARSLLGAYMALRGVTAFWEELPAWADGALLDTRVLLAHEGLAPDDDDRFASNLLLPDHIADPWLRALTEAAAAAPLPVLLGGHTLMGGILFAFCDILGAGWAPADPGA